MIVAEKEFLHQAIDNLSDTECLIVSKMFKGLLFDTQDTVLEELPQNEIAEHLKILDDMHKGEYSTLGEIKQELNL